MPAMLLKTKLFVPRRRVVEVARPRLLQCLDRGLEAGHPLTLVSAPAGYGKSTLLGTWLAGLEEPSAWVSLDPEDNDPSRFLTYLVAALHGIDATVCPGTMAALESDQLPGIPTLLTLLINELAELDHDVVLVLDDLHVVTEEPVHDALGFLIERAPPSLHLVLATRVDPPLPLSRFRAAGQMTELRAVDLRFGVDETGAFLSDVMHLEIDEPDVATLGRRTEGWIVGLQLAALSLAGRDDPHAFVESFSGDHQHVLDYLLDEVLDRQPPERQRFLRATSVLERFDPALCDCVLEASGSGAVLAELERANLFVIALDDRRGWYRYHHLFAELLRDRLSREGVDRVRELHGRAARWYRDSGLVPDALGHALAADDLALADELLRALTADEIRRGRVTAVQYWSGRITDEQLIRQPSLGPIPIWMKLWVGEMEAVEEMAWHLGGLAQEMAPSPEKEFVDGNLALLTAWGLDRAGQIDDAVPHAEAADRLLTDPMYLPRCMTPYIPAHARHYRGDLEGCLEFIAEAERRGRVFGDVWVPTLAAADQMIKTIECGDLAAAERHFVRGWQLAQERDAQRWGSVCRLTMERAAMLWERGELDEALEEMEAARAQIEGWVNVDDTVRIHTIQAQLSLSVGDVEGARRAVEENNRFRRGRLTDPFIELRREVSEVHTWLAMGDLDSATSWADALVETPYVYHEETRAPALARVRLAQGRPREALTVVEQRLEGSRRGGRQRARMELLATGAVALEQLGQREDALDLLREAVVLAAPQGFVQLFVELGMPMRTLLSRAVGLGPWTDAGVVPFVRALLDSMATSGTPRQAAGSSAQPLVEPLSDRELEVLSLVAHGLSNAKVAQQLFISVNTVKTHMHNVRGKLQADNRTHAVSIARELGLID